MDDWAFGPKGFVPKMDPYGIPYYEDLLLRCQERDRIQTGRPEGCVCLGYGATHCACPEGQEALRLEKEAEWIGNQAREKLRQERIWDTSGVPIRFYGYSLETSPVKTTMPELIVALTNHEQTSEKEVPYWDTDQWTRSWFLWGQHGVGKTGLAVGYGRERLLHWGSELVFETVPTLLYKLRCTMSPKRREDIEEEDDQPTEQSLMERYLAAEVLILDDLGVERVTEWAQERLYMLIGHRHDEGLTTIFTSNLSLEDVAAKLGERTTWRILEMCGPDNIVEVKGPNLRDLKHG